MSDPFQDFSKEIVAWFKPEFTDRHIILCCSMCGFRSAHRFVDVELLDDYICTECVRDNCPEVMPRK